LGIEGITICYFFISKLGIETSSFVAILGAMGLAVGLSLQGSLSNFAGGMLIILFKPFRVGDLIEAQGIIATVNEIQIFVLHMQTIRLFSFQMVFLMALLTTLWNSTAEPI
jgi:small-conductance mechanosensitive channel